MDDLRRHDLAVGHDRLLGVGMPVREHVKAEGGASHVVVVAPGGAAAGDAEPAVEGKVHITVDGRPAAGLALAQAGDGKEGGEEQARKRGGAPEMEVSHTAKGLLS